MPEARLTPFQLAFAEAGFDGSSFPQLREEARARGVDTRDPVRFPFLTVAADALREMIPEGAPPEMLEQFRPLLFHAYNFWSAGRHVYLLDTPVARYLVEAAPALSDWQLRLSHSSLYVQLPRNLFWARIAENATPEPVDGFFATAFAVDGADAAPTAPRLQALLVLGLLPDRPGFSVITVDRELATDTAAGLISGPGREGGSDFTNILPGGELRGLYSIVSDVEAVKLVARALWYIDQHLGSLPEQDGVSLVTLTGGPA